MSRVITFSDAVIADSATTSNSIDTLGFTVTGLYIPAGFEGTVIKFTGATRSASGTYLPVYDTAGEVSLTVAASRYYSLSPDLLAGVRHVKLVAGTSQTGATTIEVALTDLN